MTSRRRSPWLLAVLALVLGAAGCGLSANSEPQAIPPENLPPGLLDPNPSSSTTLPESGATTSVIVYFLERDGDTTRLARVEREVTDETQAGERIGALFRQPTPGEQAQGLTTSIPADTVLLDTELDDANDELVINLSSELFSVQGQELANAFAQLVWTVSELDGVRQVRFLIDGEVIRAPDANGAEKDGAVTTADYFSLAPAG